jgi:predicted nucleic acid-binding protein
MLVVADTTPLNYLILIGAVDVLPQLFHQVCVPEAVAKEMSRASAPKPVRIWTATPPPWFEIRPVEIVIGDLPEAFSSLHAGESAALALALALQSDFVLIDERQGTKIALDLGLRPMGTLGILDVSAKQRLIDLAIMVDRLKATNFRYPSALLERLLTEDARRKVEDAQGP